MANIYIMKKNLIVYIVNETALSEEQFRYSLFHEFQEGKKAKDVLKMLTKAMLIMKLEGTK